MTRLKSNPQAAVLVFHCVSGQQVELDLRVDNGESAEKEPAAPVGPGRPRLGVVGREVTLLPRHWEWLGSQAGGASVVLRKLVETAMREFSEEDRTRQRHEAAYRFMTALAGNLAGYEEALRSLFANDRDGFVRHTREWPVDVRQFAQDLAFPA